MNNYKLLIQYDGTRYSGWQKQGNTDNTIQGKIENVLTHMTGSPVEINGSGRTDAGVHALGQVANFKLSKSLATDLIQSYLNEHLSKDIRILSVEETNDKFHARLSATKKHYRYIVDTNPFQDVFTRKYAMHSTKTYDIEKMKKAAELLTGKHDFKSFCGNRHMKKSTIRCIDSIAITTMNSFGSPRDNTTCNHNHQSNNSFSENGIIEFDFWGDGFLYNMVRILTGTLLEVGEGKKGPDEMLKIIAAKDRRAAGFTAPAAGLYLVEVLY